MDLTKLPASLPGHWETGEGAVMARVYVDISRADLAFGDQPDFLFANAVYMADRSSLDLIAYQTAAKERIRWLSVQLALARAEIDELKADRIEQIEVERDLRSRINDVHERAKAAGYRAWPDAEDIDEDPESIITELAKERDAALARIAELDPIAKEMLRITHAIGEGDDWGAAWERIYPAMDLQPGENDPEPEEAERDPTKLAASDLTDAELIAEQTRVEKLWDEANDDLIASGGHGGSPGEWMVERMDEIETEQARRAASKAA